MRAARRTGTAAGFSLIELLLVLLAIGVLATLAYPSYAAQIARSRRIEAVVAIYQVQLAQERWRANRQRYAEQLADLGLTTALSPRYRVTIADSTAAGYTLVASVVDARTDPACTSLSLSVQDGQTFYGSTGSAPARACWNR